MLGNPGIEFAFDPSAGKADVNSATNVFLPRGGKMVRHYEPFEPYESTRNLSAVIALTTHRIPNPEFARIFKEKRKAEEMRLGTRLTAGQRFGIRYSLLQSIPMTLGEASKLTVCLNPLALHPLPDSLFDGPFDERWAMVDGRLTCVFKGHKLSGA
jgi:hypothetical protein